MLALGAPDVSGRTHEGCRSDTDSDDMDEGDDVEAEWNHMGHGNKTLSPHDSNSSLDDEMHCDEEEDLANGLREYEDSVVEHYNDPRYNSLMNAPVFLPAIPEVSDGDLSDGDLSDSNEQSLMGSPVGDFDSTQSN